MEILHPFGQKAPLISLLIFSQIWVRQVFTHKSPPAVTVKAHLKLLLLQQAVNRVAKSYQQFQASEELEKPSVVSVFWFAFIAHQFLFHKQPKSPHRIFTDNFGLYILSVDVLIIYYHPAKVHSNTAINCDTNFDAHFSWSEMKEQISATSAKTNELPDRKEKCVKIIKVAGALVGGC